MSSKYSLLIAEEIDGAEVSCLCCKAERKWLALHLFVLAASVVTSVALGVAYALQHGAAAPASLTPLGPIRFGVIDLAFYTTTTIAMQQLLSAQFGISSVIFSGLHADLYPKIGTGEVDYITGWWPGNAPFITGPHVNVAAQVLPISTVYRGAGLFWLVPGYLDPGLVSLANLSLPVYAGAFVKDVICFAQGTELPVAALHALERYQLGAYNFTVAAGVQADVYAYMQRLYQPATKQAFLVVSTQPTFFDTDVFRMRPLADPLLAMGSPTGQNGMLMASRSSGVLDRLPAAAQRALARVSFSVEQVNDIGRLWMQRQAAVSPEQAVEQYLRVHPELMKAWLDDSFDATLSRLSLPLVPAVVN